ncbi:MAG: hypothetical protein CMB48_05615 [Euryarchaeota archaeon]|mgnify:CR=1 FL=1|nr:hypothetical protein [Euryarchaeota archaeon]
MPNQPQSNYFISLDEAKEITQSIKIPIKEEIITIENAHNRILSQDIFSKVNDPPFDNSSMDGYAVIYSDTIQATNNNPIELKIIDTIAAGTTSKNKLQSGFASKIMTGAPIPKGADSIIMVEKTEKKGQIVKLFHPSFQNYIRFKGENISKDQLILQKGTILTPRHIGLLATSGHSKISVFKKLKITIISTGDELISPGKKLSPGQIYESNSYVLEGLVKDTFHFPIRVDVVQDSIKQLKTQLDKATLNSDLIITSGGVSMGDFDIVRNIMESDGEILFWRIKIKPGSPPLFGKWNGKPIFGLPGNPASSFVVFKILIEPWLKSITHSFNNNKIIKAKLLEDIKSKADFQIFNRVYVENNGHEMVAFTKTHQGSGNINSLTTSNGLTLLPPGVGGAKNEIIDILLI